MPARVRRGGSAIWGRFHGRSCPQRQEQLSGVWSRMLQVVGAPRRIDRAIKRLQGALKGVAARGVRLTWRGGELRTTIHWARDDSFWWAFEPPTTRNPLLLSPAPAAPANPQHHPYQFTHPPQPPPRNV